MTRSSTLSSSSLNFKTPDGDDIISLAMMTAHADGGKFTLTTGADGDNTHVVLAGVATPSLANDAANKSYVDAAVQGLHVKDPVRVATTTSGTLASSFAAGESIDGVTLEVNDRILIKDQLDGCKREWQLRRDRRYTDPCVRYGRKCC